MVVVQHQQLHNVLWGPAARDGRTKRSDVVVYVQLALVMALGVWQLYEFDKPAAMRLAACGAALLLYFRSVSLFVRLIMLLSFLMAYGDIFVPAKRALKASESFALRHVPLLVYAQLLFNNGKIVWLVLRAMPGKQRKPLDARRSLIRKPKAA